MPNHTILCGCDTFTDSERIQTAIRYRQFVVASFYLYVILRQNVTKMCKRVRCVYNSQPMETEDLTDVSNRQGNKQL